MITGTGSIATVGAGNLVLHGSNGFTRLSVNSGMVTFGSNTARRVEGIALAHRAMLAAGTAGFVLANAIITGCAETLNNGTGSFILNGAISGPGSIAKVGSGILVFKATTALLGLASKPAPSLLDAALPPAAAQSRSPEHDARGRRKRLDADECGDHRARRHA